MPTNWTTWKKWTNLFETYNLPGLSQEEKDNLNIPITIVKLNL